MPSLKDIRKRIASVKNTQKITRAMKLVSAAKLRRAQEAMLELRPYAAKHQELLSSLVAQLGDAAGAHPLLQQREVVKTIGVLAVTSDRGLCGGFNSSIQKQLIKLQARARDEGKDVRVYPLGRRMNGFVAKRDFEVPEALGEIIPATSTEAVRRITELVSSAFLSGELDEVIVLSNRFQSAIAQVPTELQLLPVSESGEAGDGAEGGDLLYEPDQTTLLGHVVPRYVEVQVRQAILESIAGEHAARMNAMNSATDNATDMIASLTLQMNRARQAAITTELMEIIGGAEALK